MKKIFAILLSLSVLLTLAGCGAAANDVSSAGVATTTPRQKTQATVPETLAPVPEETLPAETTPEEQTQTPTVSVPEATEPETPAPEVTEPETTIPQETTPEQTVTPPAQQNKPEPTTPAEPQHTHSYTKTVVAPTCTKAGYTVNKCDCGTRYNSDEVQATGHTFSQWHTVKAPTYDATGLDRRECTACGKTEDKTIGKLVQNHTHSYKEQLITAPTCSAPGWRQYTCACGESYGETVESLAHDDVVTEERNCMAASYWVYTCKVCGSVRKEDMKIPASHNFVYVLRDLTCTQDGYNDYTCTKCGYIYFTEPVRATGHVWQHGGCETYNICTVCAEQGTFYHHNWNANTGLCYDCGKNICDYFGHEFADSTKKMCTNWNCNACDPEFNQVIENILAEIITPGMSEVRKVLAIHDYIVNNTEYDYDNYLNGTIPRKSHLAVGPLMHGVAVCDGYARAFKLLCDYVGIECVVASGTAWSGGGHAWNQVKVGGKWYNIDVCWDDPVSSQPVLRYDEFLLSDERFYKDHVKDPYEQYYTCDEDHPEDGFKRPWYF